MQEDHGQCPNDQCEARLTVSRRYCTVCGWADREGRQRPGSK